MSTPIIQVDAFTDQPFAGNPAAVALLDDQRPDSFLQALALEMNLSETAYPMRRDDGDWDLRWFTPAAEVDLCGHATLATAHVLFEQDLVGDEVTFHTRSGALVCKREGSGIAMDFPSSPCEPSGPIDGLAEALGATVVDQGVSFDVLAQLESPEAVAALEPDMGLLAQLDTRAVVATAAGDVAGGAADFVSRVFAPAVGIPEDPVTGSAHCILAPWWADRLESAQAADGVPSFAAHQISPRGGRLQVELHGDRVRLVGQAVTVMTAELRV